MAPDPLLEAADRLYALTLPEFTPARDALARELKSSDKDLSARVKALKKPSLAAWVVNLLVRREPEQVEQVLGVGVALREAQASLAGEELRALTRQRRQLTAAVTTTARGHALDLGQRITSSVADEVEATLTAAMVDGDAADAVRSGLLVRSLATTGLGDLDLTAYVAVPEAAGFVPTPIGEPEPPEPPDLHVVPDPDADEKKLRAAQEALEAVQVELDEATAALKAAHADVESLEARSLQVQAEIDELRRRLGELESDQDEIDEELEEAQVVVQAASADVSSAEAGRVRAEKAVERLRTSSSSG
jgi:hypothetical protein